MSLEYSVGDSVQFVAPTDARLVGMFGRVVNTSDDDLVVEFYPHGPAGYAPTVQVKACMVKPVTITFIIPGGDHG